MQDGECEKKVQSQGRKAERLDVGWLDWICLTTTHVLQSDHIVHVSGLVEVDKLHHIR